MDDFRIDKNSPAAASEAPEPGPVRSPRGFAAIHRDVWRLVGHSPMVFMLLPAALWLLTDFLLELASSTWGGDEWSQLKLYLRLAQIAEAVVGTLVTSVALAALVEVGQGRSVTVGAALRKGLALWGEIIKVFLAVLWRAGFALLLFIIPGIYLMLRYALSAPVVAFEGETGKGALDRSAVCMKGNYWRVFRGVWGAAMIYGPVAFLPILLIPDDAGPWTLAVASIPMNVLTSFITIGLALIYADSRNEEALVAPVGRVEESEVAASGRWGVTLAVLASVVALVWIGAYFYQLELISMADDAWEHDAYEESLELYKEADSWGLENAYLKYSIGWALYALDHTEEAEQYFSRAVELEPKNPQYRVDHARALIELMLFSEAREELEIAREQGFPDTELLGELESLADCDED